MGKDHKKSRREEKDHGSEDRERLKTSDTSKEKEKRISSRDRREGIEERDKEKNRDKGREKDYDHRDRYRDKEHERDNKDQKDKGKDKDRDRGRETEKENHDRGRERKEKEKGRDRAKDREREKHKDRERETDKERDKDRDKYEREKGKGKDREKDRETDRDNKERSKDREREKVSGKNREESHDGVRDGGKNEKGNQQDGGDGHKQRETSEVGERILKMKEERLKRRSEGVSEILGWVNKSRKLEEKISSEKEKALHLSKVFEEQDNIDQGESEEEEPAQHTTKDLAGVKVLHGLDKVIEGGAVVLTLKDQNILADGDLNNEIDMLENVEIGEQKQRDDAYKAAKKKIGVYEDKFNDEPGSLKKMLPQYDDPVENEGVTLDESGRFTGEAEKKLEELRKRLQGAPTGNHFEDLNSSGKISSDYYTQEEMLQFKKPKKKKSLRKKDKLDLEALEAEAISAGLGVGDLGSRNSGKRQAAKEEQERSEAQTRSNAYQLAYAKAEEASKALRQELAPISQMEEDGIPVFGDDDEDFHKSLEKARKLALKKQDEVVASGPQAVASLAVASSNQLVDTPALASGETQENKVVFTEMDEFVWGLQLDEESHKPVGEDVFMDEGEVVKASSDQEMKDETGGWTVVKETSTDEQLLNEEKEDIVPDETTHEVAVGKGLSGALQLLKERGTLKESIEWGGRNMDKKKSKLVGIHESDGPKEINIERTDEFGRIMTPKEAFRVISHKFHGKGPGKTKQEKRMKQYQEELKLKQMKNSDTPSQSMERMREAQARLKTPYLVLSGHVKPGQNSDPRSGFATVENLPGGLTPMLGDRKVEHFLGIKRKAEPGSMGPPKKQMT